MVPITIVTGVYKPTYKSYNWLVGWLAGWWLKYVFHCFSHHIVTLTIPTDELRFFRGVGQPPNSWLMDDYSPGFDPSPCEDANEICRMSGISCHFGGIT